MTDKQGSRESNDLRQKAEKRLSDNVVDKSVCISEAEALALLHELQVHQIELELQNEDLQRIREELEEQVEQQTRELRETNARLASVLESITDCHFLLDYSWRFLEINAAAERLIFQQPAKKLLGKVIWEEYPQAIDSEFYHKAILASTECKSVHFEDHSWINEAKWFECHIYQRPDMLEVYLRDITDRKEADIRQREFYRRTIFAATQGKLVIMERDDIHKLSGPSIKQWDINSNDDISAIHADIMTLAKSMGMDQLNINRLSTCIIESISNVLKHAGKGKISLHRIEDDLLLLVEDNGPGIGAINIPDVALLYGYSTEGTLGMGYKLIITSSKKVYLATGPDGTIVAFKIALHNDGENLPIGRDLYNH